MSQSFFRMPKPKPPGSPLEELLHKILGTVLMSGLVFMLVWSWLDSGNENQQPEASKSLSTRKAEALVYCQARVRDSLKSPKTADFPWDAQATVGADETIFTVASYVDAKNAFNAEIRTPYICVVEYEPWGSGEGKITEFSLMP